MAAEEMVEAAEQAKEAVQEEEGAKMVGRGAMPAMVLRVDPWGFLEALGEAVCGAMIAAAEVALGRYCLQCASHGQPGRILHTVGHQGLPA